MKNHAFKALIIALVLNASLSSMAASNFSDADYFERSQRISLESNLNYLTKALTSPSFIPHEDVNFLEVINHLKNYPDSKTYEIFRILKQVTEHYKKILDITTTQEGRDIILTEMSKLITSSSEYFTRSKNELGIQYFENLDLFIADETKKSLSSDGYSADNKSRAEQDARRAAVLAEESARANTLYQNFKFELKKSSNENLSPLKILITQAENLRKEFLAANLKQRGPILGSMITHGSHALKFSLESNDQFGTKYFKQYDKFILRQTALWNNEFSEESRRADAEAQALLDKQVEEVNLRAVTDQIQDYVLNPKDPTFLQDKWIPEIKGTKLKFHFKEIHIEKSTGNVFYLASKNNIKRIFTVEIVEPSIKATEAVQIAVGILLKLPEVYGVYFENLLRIPSNLDKNSYETRSLGKGRVLLRQRALVCSALFS